MKSKSKPSQKSPPKWVKLVEGDPTIHHVAAAEVKELEELVGNDHFFPDHVGDGWGDQ